MDNRTALGIALVVIAIFVADAAVFHWDLPTMLGKLLARISDWMAFWR